MTEVINDIIENYLVLILMLLFGISIGAGLLSNLKKLRSDDKNIKDEGIIGFAYVAGGVFIAVFLLGVLFRAVTSGFSNWSV